MIDTGLDGRVVVVTGANQGIGAATSVALAAEGAAVMVAFKRMEPARDPAFPEAYDELRTRDGELIAEQIRAAGGRAEAAEVDLTEPESARLLFDRAESVFGPVEILVNNASGWLADTFLPDARDRFGRTLRPVDAESYDRQFAVDVRAPALLIAEFARRHIARGATWGRIIGLTSGSPEGFPEEVSYGAAKAAQENYTMSAAAELAPHGVTANMVRPWATDTGWITDTVRDAVRHVATPEEVADVILFLASHQARGITGQIIKMS
jgi:3-oxoacyl-[acyl-carrier protein] reductase